MMLMEVCCVPQPSHNDKYSNPEMIRVMSELAKARKQLKGKNMRLKCSRLCTSNINVIYRYSCLLIKSVTQSVNKVHVKKSGWINEI